MSKLRDDLYQMLHGFKPVKRGYKKQGQSDWYYLDPRGASTVASMEQIDVADENAINPQINSILADDMAKNPNDYYIWRTRQDNKVRGKHAEQEGKIFNKHIPPVDGNPGEDYNCRCWAEPYKPEKNDRLGITAKVDLSGLPQYAENDKAEVKSDVVYASDDYAHRHIQFRSAEEEKLLRRIGKQIISREDFKRYAYLDSSGYITTGNGALVNDWNDFKKVHWLYNGRPATEIEMRAEFERMQKVRTDIITEAQEQARKIGKPVSNPFQKLTAKVYEKDAILTITKDEANYLMYSHLQKDYDNLKHYLPAIDKAPAEAQDVAFDIQYNPGITDNTWTYFKRHFNGKNVPELAKQVHRKGISEDRNDEMKDKILSIKKW